MLKRANLLAGLGAAILSFPAFADRATAQSGCTPEFLQIAQSVSINDIEVSSGGFTRETFQIRIRNTGDPGTACPVTLRVARLSTSPSSGAIAYTLQARGQNLEILPGENFPGTAASDLRIPQLPPSTNGLAVPFQLTIPSEWGLPEGSQTDDLVAFLIDDSGAVVDELNLTIALSVRPSVELRIVGATGRDAIASVNLGTLDPETVNTSAPFGLRVWSTSPYTLTFRSENDGRLVHDSAPGSIAYQLFLDGGLVNTKGAPAGSEPDGTDALGDFHPLSVQVMPFRARAGEYSDRVEVTVSAN